MLRPHRSQPRRPNALHRAEVALQYILEFPDEHAWTVHKVPNVLHSISIIIAHIVANVVRLNHSGVTRVDYYSSPVLP